MTRNSPFLIASVIDCPEKSPPYESISVHVKFAADLFIAMKGFEDLLSSTNVLNRKLEEVLGMTKEYNTIASLWQTFYQLMRNSSDDFVEGESVRDEQNMGGLPGTGGHVVTVTAAASKLPRE